MVTLTYFTVRSNLVPYAFVWENGKTMDFSETVVFCDIKVGRCSKLNFCMNLFIINIKGHSDSIFSNFFSLAIAKPIKAKFYVEVESTWDEGMKVNINALCHKTKMAAMLVYGKNLYKSSFLEPKGWWPWNLVCGICFSSTTKGVGSRMPIIGPVHRQ